MGNINRAVNLEDVWNVLAHPLSAVALVTTGLGVLLLCAFRWARASSASAGAGAAGSLAIGPRPAASTHRRVSPARHGPRVPPSLQRLSQKHYTVFSHVRIPALAPDGMIALDHVVVSRHGIFVVKINHETGTVDGAEPDSFWIHRRVWRRRAFANPIWQNADRLKALARFLDMPPECFHSVIFFPRAGGLAERLPANVLSAGLGRFIAKQRHQRLSADEHGRALQLLSLTASAHRDGP